EALCGERDRAGELHVMVRDAERQRRQHDGAGMDRGGDSLRESVRHAIVGRGCEIGAVLLGCTDRNQREPDVLLRAGKLDRSHLAPFVPRIVEHHLLLLLQTGYSLNLNTEVQSTQRITEEPNQWNY